MLENIEAKTAKTGFLYLPKTFYAVLFIEFWERFAFYAIQSVAVIYFVEKFGIKESQANNLYGSFSAILFAMLTVGGIIGDKILGLRRTYLLGIIFLIIGYAFVSMAQTEVMLYYGMAIVLVGNIFFKTNANNYVGRCFESNDPRLDSAFTYFYMSINTGSFFSSLFVPVIVQKFNYKVGLSLASIAMVMAFLSYLFFRSRFIMSDNKIGKNGYHMVKKITIVIIVALMLVLFFSYILHDLALSKILLYTIAVLTLIVYLAMASKMKHIEAKGMYIALILTVFAVIFYVLYIQIATSMTFFALHNVRLTILGYTLPAGSLQAFNPFFVIIFSPLLANFYIKLHKSQINYTISAKFVTGTFLMGICFISLGFGGQFFADSMDKISILWLVLAYAFYSAGELLVSALGASMVAQLLPKRFGGFGQGVWFLGSGVGMKIGGELSGLAAVNHTATSSSYDTLHSYLTYFYKLGGVTVIIAIALSFSIKPLSKAMQSMIGSKSQN